MNDSLVFNVAAATKDLAVSRALERAATQGFEVFFYNAEAVGRIEDPTDDDYWMMNYRVAMLGHQLSESEMRVLDGNR